MFGKTPDNFIDLIVTSPPYNVGINYSDVVLEALSCGVPGVSYQNFSSKLSKLEQFDSNLAVSDVESLFNLIDLAKKGLWPSDDQWSNIHQNLVGKADGNCLDRIRTNISEYIDNVKIIRS